MSENLLNALMELTALFARLNKTRFIDNAQSLLKTYLDQTVSIKNSRLLIRKFYEFLYAFNISPDFGFSNEISLKKNINEIVRKINSELNEEERLVLFLSFLELIKLDKKVEPEELTFVEILSNELRVSENDYKNSLLFILSDNSQIKTEDNKDFLIISNKSPDSADELEGSWIEQNRPHEIDEKLFLIKSNLDGDILVLRFQGSQLFTARYFGKEPLFLNGNRIFQDNFFILRPFDQIKTGESEIISSQEILSKFKLTMPQTVLKFVGQNVGIKSKGKLKGISPFNFSEEPGNLVAILCNGVNESNEISLLLSGQLPLNSGHICLNGYNIYSDRYRVHKMIGLVTRENIFDENISIYENFWFSARLSFPGYSHQKIEHLVEQTLQNLGLAEFSRIPIKKIVNGISSEYLKVLVNTGIELIRDPFILVLDLPLEKLNSCNSDEFCNILKTEANKGKLIFVTTINPGTCILKRTDRIWIFDEGGYIIYRGLANNALNYFRNAGFNLVSEAETCKFCGNTNAEHLYQIIHAKIIDDRGKTTSVRKTSPADWHKLYQKKIEANESKAESRKVIPSYASSIPNVNLQFNEYFKKCVSSFISTPKKVLMVLTGGFIISFLIAGLLRYDWSDKFTFSQHEYLPLLFFMNTLICFVTGIILGMQFTLSDKLHIAIDHYKNYSFFSYLNVKYVLITFLSLIFSIVFTLITDWVSSIDGLFFRNWLIYFSTVIIGGSLGLFFGYIHIHLRNSLYIALIVFILDVLFSGYILPYHSLPKQLSSTKYVPAFAEIFPCRWSFEALVVQQVKDNPFQKMLFTTEQTISDLTFKTNTLIPKLQETLFKIQNDSETTSKFSLFYKELSEINKKYPDIFQFEFLEELKKKPVNSEVISELEDYMRYVQFRLYEKLNETLTLRINQKQKLRDSVGSENYEVMMKSYYNSPLYSFISAKKPGKNYLETKDDIIQLDDPIYRLPENNFGRSHFFAPQKLMNGYYYDTTYFNLFVLWLQIFTIYILTLILRRKSLA